MRNYLQARSASGTIETAVHDLGLKMPDITIQQGFAWEAFNAQQ